MATIKSRTAYNAYEEAIDNDEEIKELRNIVNSINRDDIKIITKKNDRSVIDATDKCVVFLESIEFGELILNDDSYVTVI